MTNLLAETIEAIHESGHKVDDIVFIGSVESGHSCNWEEFEVLADKEYHSGFGSQKVASDLEIVFSDGLRMWRNEYDGSEWWMFSKPVILPNERKEIKSLFPEFSGSFQDIDEDYDND